MYHVQSIIEANFMKKSKIKVKVTNFTPNVDGTVMHDKMKYYHNLNNNMKQRIEKDRNYNNNNMKLNDHTGDAVQYVLSKRIDNSSKKKKKKESQIIESESSSNEDTKPIMQLLKKSPNKREKSNEDLTPISQLVKETKTTPKKKLFTESNKMKNKEVLETIEDDTTPISKLLKQSKKLMDDDTTHNESKKKKTKLDKTEEMATVADLMNHSKKKTKKDETSTTTTKNIRKQKCYKKKNKDNLDLEEDEADIIWEINRDWTLEYFRRNNAMKTKRQILNVKVLENYRKQVAKEGELLIHWEDGCREWAFCCNVKIDAKAAMYNAAIK